MGDELSRVTIVILLIVTVAISLISTWTVIDSVESVQSNPTAGAVSSELPKDLGEASSEGNIKFKYGHKP